MATLSPCSFLSTNCWTKWRLPLRVTLSPPLPIVFHIHHPVSITICHYTCPVKKKGKVTYVCFPSLFLLVNGKPDKVAWVNKFGKGPVLKMWNEAIIVLLNRYVTFLGEAHFYWSRNDKVCTDSARKAHSPTHNPWSKVRPEGTRKSWEREKMISSSVFHQSGLP